MIGIFQAVVLRGSCVDFMEGATWKQALLALILVVCLIFSLLGSASAVTRTKMGISKYVNTRIFLKHLRSSFLNDCFL